MQKQSLPTAVLGRTKLAVTRLGFGAMEIRGSRIWGGRPVTEDQARTILNAVLDAGVNFIDTSNDYGRSEVRRDDATDDTPHVWTRENLFRGLHESLARLKTDYVDIMQLHNPPA